jgi:hypothetical protein
MLDTPIVEQDRIVAAGIACVVCGARPYPELGPPGTREEFDLLKLVERKDGVWVAADVGEGSWFCRQHRRETSKGRFVVEAAP